MLLEANTLPNQHTMAATAPTAGRRPPVVVTAMVAVTLVGIGAITTSCEAFAPISPPLVGAGRHHHQQQRCGTGTRPSSILHSSTTAKADDKTSVADKGEEEKKEQDEILSTMPWSDLQSWALRDQLPKYVITIPVPGSSNGSSDKPKYGTYALWRTMLKETTELSGYDVEYVRRAYERDVEEREDWAGYAIGAQGKESSKTAPGVLPLLESFEFHPDGGVSGLAYGIPGIAGGSSIRTTAVSNIQKTVFLGYVETEDGSAAYELGSPAGDFYSSSSSGGLMSEDARRTMLENVARAAAGIVETGTAGAARAGELAADAASAGDEVDANLVNLAGTTAIMLAGATAIGMVSHHLTVNVFWV